MEEKRLQNAQKIEKEQTQKAKRNEKDVDQGVLELIEDSLGDVSGGVHYGGITNVDNYNHFGK